MPTVDGAQCKSMKLTMVGAQHQTRLTQQHAARGRSEGVSRPRAISSKWKSSHSTLKLNRGPKCTEGASDRVIGYVFSIAAAIFATCSLENFSFMNSAYPRESTKSYSARALEAGFIMKTLRPSTPEKPWIKGRLERKKLLTKKSS